MELQTAQEELMLYVDVDREEIYANGADLVYITVELRDRNGIVDMQARKNITIEIEGVGILQGFGNADPYFQGDYHQYTVETFESRVQAVIRAGFDAGEIRVRFRAEGCQKVETCSFGTTHRSYLTWSKLGFHVVSQVGHLRRKGDNTMKISAFYENILEGVINDGLDMKIALAQLKQDGMEKVYFSYDTLKNDIEGKIMEMLQELELEVEGLYGFFRFDRYPMDDGYQDMIDMALKVNAGNVLFVPGFITEDDKQEEKQLLENMWTGLKKAVQYGKSQGIAVSIEDFDGLDSPYCRVDGVAEFLKNVSGLQFSFDTGNFVMYHDDEEEAFELFKDKICTVHLKDRCREKDLVCGSLKKERPYIICADGEKLYTVPVGDGFIHIKEILSMLKQQGYDGGLVAEMYGHPAENMYDGIRKSVKWISETWDAI